jgi:outer membrane protein insertion porin family
LKTAFLSNYFDWTTMYQQLPVTLFSFLCLLFFLPLQAQETGQSELISYGDPIEYEIGGIRVVGSNFSDENAIILLSGLRVGNKVKIPGPDIAKAVKNLWKLKLFTDIQIVQSRTAGDVVFLEIVVQELPRLSKYAYRGVRKSFHSDLNLLLENILLKGGIVTENTQQSAISAINRFFRDKGFLDVETSVISAPDEVAPNSVALIFDINRSSKVKIKDIVFTGNEDVKSSKLRKKMKNTKRKSKLFSSSKLVQSEYNEDKASIITYYNSLGYRDARIVSDSIWRSPRGHLMIAIDIYEGNKYFFRNISWKGNTIYDDRQLTAVLGIEKGDVYNQELMETRLRFSQDGRDVSSLYMDDGYLFFSVDPTEIAVIGDSIDLEMRIFEGPQATIDRVTIKGNDRTNEHVIRRELRTVPGQKFSRSDIIRSQRQIINLGYFNPENLDINTPVNFQRGTVDIDYTVEEKPSDQLELSAGYSQFSGVIGTLGVTFNNFSMKNILKKEAWSPLPQGDGQRFSVRVQSNGRFFQAYNISLTEPWFGGKKPTSFTVAGFYNKVSTFAQKGSEFYGFFSQGGVNVGLGTRLRWPDDNFVFNTTLTLQNMQVNNYLDFFTDQGERIRKGSFNNFNVNVSLTRTTISDPIFPRDGSKFMISGQFTPPYSLFRGDVNYAEQTPEQRFRWLEYHKWKIEIEWYKTIVEKLVFRFQGKIGILGSYNSELGNIPFERYELGGDGLTNQFQALTGREIISSRGYDIDDIPANRPGGATAYNKFTAELRYPISLNPNASIYVTTFAQGINAFSRVDQYNPFDLRRSAGIGLRVFLPMFGTLGFDYGIGFDKVPSGATPPFKLTDYGRFNIVLGFEPE